MATRPSTVEHILAQAGGAGALSARKMFGEYGLYCRGVMVALVCDDRLYVKPTAGGRAVVGTVEEAPPYPGAKNCFVIDEERIDDVEWLVRLFIATATELPQPAKKARKARAKS